MNALKKFFAPVDMTVGTPWKNIALFTIPMVIGNIAQQLYNTVDSIVVGKFVGDNALAAVGSASPIFNLLLVLFIGISVGTSVMVSQYYGAKDRVQLSHAIGCSITLTAIASIFIMIVGSIIVRPLLEMLNTPESIIDWCDSYLTVLMLGIAGVAYYNILSGVLRGMGDSFSALVYLLIATVINIVLDVWFVAQFGMGVMGVALATVIAQGVSALLCLRKLMKMKEFFDITPEYLKPTKHHSLTMVRLGLPSGLTQAIMSMAMMVVQSLTNTMGEMVIAANVIIMRVDGFAMMPNFSFGQAMSVFSGQNVGAGKWDRVKKGVLQGSIIAVAFAVVIVAVILFANTYLFGIFTQTEALIDLASRMMNIMAVGYIAMSITQVLGGVMRGCGDTVTPMWISIISTVVLRIPIAYALAALSRSEAWPHGHPFALSASLLVSWTMGMILSVAAYRFGKTRKLILEKIGEGE